MDENISNSRVIKTMNQVFTNPELSGKLKQKELFFIDNERYEIWKLNVSENFITIPRPSIGQHKFSFNNSFCSQPIVINADTKVNITCNIVTGNPTPSSPPDHNQPNPNILRPRPPLNPESQIRNRPILIRPDTLRLR